MQDEAPKPLVIAVLWGVAFGLTTHVWYGIYFIAKHGDGVGITIPAIAFLAAWLHLVVRCIKLPSGASYRYHKSFPLFFSVLLPFVVPSAITLAVLAISDMVTMSVLFTMTSGLVSILAIPSVVWLCVWASSFRNIHRDTATDA